MQLFQRLSQDKINAIQLMKSEGRTLRQIAAKLIISTHTANKYVQLIVKPTGRFNQTKSIGSIALTIPKLTAQWVWCDRCTATVLDPCYACQIREYMRKRKSARL